MNLMALVRSPRFPRPAPLIVFSLLLAGMALSNVFSVSRTADYVRTGLDISANSTLNVTLPNGKIVSGTVQDSSGGAVAGALVEAISSDGFASPFAAAGVTGSFQLPVRLGTHRLEVRPPFSTTDDLADFPRLVPTTTVTYTVNKDLPVGSVTLPDGYVVTGNVSSASGSATNVAGWLFAIPTGGASPWGVTPAVFGTGAQARNFFVALPAGRYNLSLIAVQGFTSKWDMVPMTSYGTNKVTVSKDMTANMKIPSGARFTGSVKDKSGNIVNGALVIKKRGSSPLVDGGTTVMLVTNGAFIGYLPKGQYDAMFVPMFNDAYTGLATKTGTSFTIGTSASTLSITADNGVILSGKITNAKGKVVSTASITAFPSGAAPEDLASLPLTAKADSKTGVYRLRVPPGTYDIQAVPKGFGPLSEIERLAATLR